MSPQAAAAGAQAGQAGAFLRQESGARGAALGGAMTAVTDDAASLSCNPAGLSRLLKPEIGATHVTLFEDTSYDFASAGFASRWGGFAGAFTRQSSGGFERRSGPNDTPVNFSISQSAFLAGWGYTLPFPKSLSLGLSVKTVRETIDHVSPSAPGADAGMIFQPWERFMVGLMVQNIIPPEMTFVSEPIKYARAVDVSPAHILRFSPDWQTLLALKLSKIQNESLRASGGMELGYRRFAFLRLGMQDKGLSTGVGAKLGNSYFDYAAQLHALGISHLVSFTQRFGQTKEELEDTIRRGISALTREEGVRLSKAYLRKADGEIKEKRLTEALRDLEAASLLDPENKEIPERIRGVSTDWDESLRKQMKQREAMQARQELETTKKLRQAETENKIKQRQGLQTYIATQIMEAGKLSTAKDYTAALRTLEAALRRDPDNASLEAKTASLRAMLEQRLTPETRKNIEQLYYRAVEQYLKGDYESASKLADEVGQLDPASQAARTLKDKIDAAIRYSQ
ncbi:MAG: hypothetical protein A3J74_05985 [Elusimicrobia bacterium RIFCSPHIGHO2_02_FULL_57_9]|nr:MAG: hypothetical protein A3J74_05985 [Elusimicrobia bacterium RIFCSPHIGHO2_02_FULL_57_9]